MAVMDWLGQRNDGAPLGIGLLDRIGWGWDLWRGGSRAPQVLADPHTCQWRHLAYASLPITEESPEASTLVIEGCRLCPIVRSGVVAGRWVPNAFGELVRVGGLASPPPRFRPSPPRERPADAEASTPALTGNAEPMAGGKPLGLATRRWGFRRRQSRKYCGFSGSVV